MIGDFFSKLNSHVYTLNDSKYFAGVMMILLNVGSKFITIKFSKSTEEYIKYSVTKQILVFSMAWLGTRDIYTALGLTAIFSVLSEYLFNEESSMCIVPHEYRVLHKLLDTDNDGVVSQAEIAEAQAVLEKAKREKNKKMQKDLLSKMDVMEFSPYTD
uniref:EF-hand domain-containing protein n=1 Tax=viral metagenome TaxID=1070528 RepID=A0A6C0E5L1_9ZZZZ